MVGVWWKYWSGWWVQGKAGQAPKHVPHPPRLPGSGREAGQAALPHRCCSEKSCAREPALTAPQSRRASRPRVRGETCGGAVFSLSSLACLDTAPEPVRTTPVT